MVAVTDCSVMLVSWVIQASFQPLGLEHRYSMSRSQGSWADWPRFLGHPGTEPWDLNRRSSLCGGEGSGHTSEAGRVAKPDGLTAVHHRKASNHY